MGYLQRYGSELMGLGYPIVPIRKGFKYPKYLDDWQEVKADKTKLKKWLSNGFADGGVGVLTKQFPAVDLDVQDDEIVEKLVSWCKENISGTVRRTGLAPKTLLAYRTDEPFTKVTSKTYEDMFGLTHKVEILGDGQQYVAFAVHPDTGNPYTWEDDQSIADVRAEELPVITLEDAQALIEYFESMIPEDWEVKSGSESGKRVTNLPVEDRLMANIKPKANISTARLGKALKSIDSEDYHEWVKVGMALWHQYDGGVEGFELWNTWSEKSDKYDADLVESKWNSFEANLLRQEPVTAATILRMARVEEEQDNGDPVERFLENYVYIEKGDLVANLTKPPHYSISKLNEFRNRTANVRHEVPAPTQQDKNKTKLEPVWKSWMVQPDRQTAEGVTYMPKADRVVLDDYGRNWINEYYIPDHASVKGDDQLKVFHKHMKYLFPIKEEREWFISWMAFNLQHPEKRCMVTPLHVATAHGTGRGWLVKLLSRLVGQWNVAKAKMDVLSGESNGSGFHEYLNNTLICAVEEVREGKKRYAVSDAIRDVLTEDFLEVNLKFGTKQTQQVFTNFFFMSNHPDALVLTEDDRRVNVFSGPEKEKSLKYYDKLYQWLDSDGVAQLYQWLMERELGSFNWKRSMHNEARQTMIENNRTETEMLFWQLMKNPPKPAMTFRQIVEEMIALSEKDAFEVDVEEGQLTKLLQQYAKHFKQIKVNGKGVRPWVLVKGEKFSNEKVREMIKKQLKR